MIFMSACIHVYICFTYVTPCVISLLINVEVLKALSADLVTQFAGQVGLDAEIYCKSDPDKSPTGSYARETDREGGRGRKLLKAMQHFVGRFPGPLMLQVGVWPSGCHHAHQVTSQRTVIWVHAGKKNRKPDILWYMWPCCNLTHMHAAKASHAIITSFLSGLTGPEMFVCQQKAFSKQRLADCNQVLFSLCLLVFPITLIWAWCGLCFTVTRDWFCSWYVVWPYNYFLFPFL